MTTQTRMTLRLATALVVGVAAINVAAAAPESAADRYVDDAPGFGNDSNAPCTNPSDPCRTIEVAIGQSQAGDVVHVGGGSYAEAVEPLSPGVSLREDDFFGFLTNGQAIIDGGAQPAVIAAPGADREIRGLTLRGGSGNVPSLVIQGGVAVEDAVLDDATSAPTHLMRVIGGGDSRIADSEVIGPDDGEFRTGIDIETSGSFEVADNQFSGFFRAIESSPPAGATATVDLHGNTIAEMWSVNGSGPAGISALQGAPGSTSWTIAENRISPAAGETIGNGLDLYLDPGTEAHLRRNRIIGFPSYGARLVGQGSATMEGDLVARNGGGVMFDLDGGAKVENATIFDSTEPTYNDIFIKDALLTLDSSIIGANGVNEVGTGTCEITNSRGPAVAANDCDTFQTTNAPGFVDPANGDYHLQPGSPMIDAGNATAPAAGATDPDGDDRSIDGDGDCTARRDIGADELVPAVPPSCGQPDPAPPEKPGTPEGEGGGSGETEPPAIDQDPPETAIERVRVKNRKAKLLASADEPEATFLCRLDRKPWLACGPSRRYRNLAEGRHRLRVRAVDAAGNVDPTPAKARFVVDG